MTDEQYFEDRFARQLRSYAAAGAPSVRREAVNQAVAAGVASRRNAPWRLRWPLLSRPMLAQAALVGLVVMTSVIVLAIWAGGNRQVVSPVPTPTASASPTRSPSAPPSASPPPSPLATGALPSLPTGAGAGWPGGLRAEPGGQLTVVGVATNDAEGDAGTGADPYVDIADVGAGIFAEYIPFALAGALPSPLPDPAAGQRISYGVVIDVDGGGVADVRAGMENALATGDEMPWTMWATDLRTGDSTSCHCDTAMDLGELAFQSWYPGYWINGQGQMAVTGSVAANAGYYVWASEANGDEVSATDYAPDAGWLALTEATDIPERANADRPGPLRPEPSGGAPVVHGTRYNDAVGDTTPGANDLADIISVPFSEGCWRSLTTEACVNFLVGGTAPVPPPDPNELWLGYGLVVDTNGDGIGDVRYGMDNVVNGRVQIWRTDLATGVTQAAKPGHQEDAVMDATYPGQESFAHIFVDRDASQPFRFYVWASAIDAAGNESTDFAPDFGWLQFKPTP